MAYASNVLCLQGKLLIASYLNLGKMREELKNFEWHTYGLKISDIDYTIQMVDKIIEDRLDFSKLKSKAHQKEGLDNEGIDDLLYYDFIETTYLWHYALIRIQGIFEGIMQQEIFSKSEKKPSGGLATKLQEMQKIGYLITQTERKELLEWGKLRNALAHFPPEEYRPGLLNKLDVVEYSKLIKDILVRWDVDNFT